MVEMFKQNYKKAKYSFVGFFTLALGIDLKRKYRLACSQFVALVLKETGDVTLPKSPYLMLPNDFMEIEGIELIYEGILDKCHFPEQTLIQG